MAQTKSSEGPQWLVKNRHYAIEVLRIFLGGLLFIKGYLFIEDISEIYALIEDNFQISSFIIAHYVAMAHLVGGIMLLFGLFTRLAALVQLPVLIGAVFFIHARDAFMITATEQEYALVVLVLLIVFFIYGGGKWSVDHKVIRKKKDAAK